MKATIQTPYGEIAISDTDIVQKSRDYSEDNHRYGIKLYCLVDMDSVVGAAFADNESDALDDLADAGKLNRWKIEDDSTIEIDVSDNETDVDGAEVTRLGNAGEPFVLPFHYTSLFEIPTPPMSVVALLAAANGVDAEEDQVEKKRLEATEALIQTNLAVLDAWHAKPSNMYKKEPSYLQPIRDALTAAGVDFSTTGHKRTL